jgi:aspartate/methionine/tyrosine aminotransferase
MKTKIFITIVLLLGISLGSLNAQKVFLGGGSSAIMPVANYNNYAYANSLFGSHAGQVKEVVFKD